MAPGKMGGWHQKSPGNQENPAPEKQHRRKHRSGKHPRKTDDRWGASKRKHNERLDGTGKGHRERMDGTGTAIGTGKVRENRQKLRVCPQNSRYGQ